MTPADIARIAIEPLSVAPLIVGSAGFSAATVVFLLDENHDFAQVIADNIEIAHALVRSAEVKLIGIEDVPATVDEYPSNPIATSSNSIMPHQRLPAGKFQRAMNSSGRVVGIDSPGWQRRILEDVVAQLERSPHSGDYSERMHAATRAHDGQVERSFHFVRALQREVTARNLSGNALISFGTDHNSHILEVAEGAHTRPMWWPQWAFVRIRSRAHP